MSRSRSTTWAWLGATLLVPLLLWLSLEVARAAAPPTLTSVQPACCKGGDPITLTGSGFSNAIAVKFGGGAEASFSVKSDTTIDAVAPPGEGNTVTFVTVTTPSGTSVVTEQDYFYYGTPRASSAFSVTGVMPNFGKGGDVITITGRGFSAVTRVTIGGADVTSFRVLGDTSITAVVPPGVGNTIVDVQVMSRDGSSQPTPQDYFGYGARPPVAPSPSPSPVPSLPAAGARKDSNAAVMVGLMLVLAFPAWRLLARRERSRGGRTA